MHASRKAGGPVPLELRAQRPDGPDVSFVTYADDDAEAAGVTEAIGAPGARRCARGRDRRAVPDQRRSRRRSRRRCPTAASPTRCAAAPGSSRAPTCARPWSCCAAVRERRTPTCRCRTRSGTSCAARAGATHPPAGRGAARERWDALQALVALADALAAAPPTGTGPPDGRRPGRRARRARRGAARPDRRGRHARVAARRQGPRVGRGVPGRAVRRSPADRAGADGCGRRGGVSREATASPLPLLRACAIATSNRSLSSQRFGRPVRAS